MRRRIIVSLSALAALALAATPALAQQRLPTIPPDQYTAEQK